MFWNRYLFDFHITGSPPVRWMHRCVLAPIMSTSPWSASAQCVTTSSASRRCRWKRDRSNGNACNVERIAMGTFSSSSINMSSKRSPAIGVALLLKRGQHFLISSVGWGGGVVSLRSRIVSGAPRRGSETWVGLESVRSQSQTSFECTCLSPLFWNRGSKSRVKNRRILFYEK